VDWGFDYKFNSLGRRELLHEAMENLLLVDSVIGKKLLNRSLEIEKEITLLELNPKHKSLIVRLTKNKLINIADEGVSELPAECELIQAATQIQIPFPGELKFTFQKNVWDQLDPLAQSSLILHEVVYEHMISIGEASSRSTRYFNAALHGGELNNVQGYFYISSLFNFKNLNIEPNTERFFGPKKSCLLSIRRFRSESGIMEDGATVIVNGKNRVTNEVDLLKALRILDVSAQRGFCD
jgi:hypothetical protein